MIRILQTSKKSRMSVAVSTLSVVIPPNEFSAPIIELNAQSPIHPAQAAEKTRNIREAVRGFLERNMSAIGRIQKLHTVIELYSYLRGNLIFLSSEFFTSEVTLLNAIYDKGDEFFHTEFENLDTFESQLVEEMRQNTGIVCDYLYYNVASVYDHCHPAEEPHSV